MINVEESRLSPLQQDVLTSVQSLGQLQPGIGDIGPKALRIAEIFLDDRVRIDALTVVHLDQDLILFTENQVEFLMQYARIQQILHANAHPGDFVAIGWTNPPTSCPDPG